MPNKVVAEGAHLSGGSTARGKKGSGASTFRGDGGVWSPVRASTRSYSWRRIWGR
jgi:hypothetical protein